MLDINGLKEEEGGCVRGGPLIDYTLSSLSSYLFLKNEESEVMDNIPINPW